MLPFVLLLARTEAVYSATGLILELTESFLTGLAGSNKFLLVNLANLVNPPGNSSVLMCNIVDFRPSFDTRFALLRTNGNLLTNTEQLPNLE